MKRKNGDEKVLATASNGENPASSGETTASNGENPASSGDEETLAVSSIGETNGDEKVLSSQLDDLRSELKSSLPEPGEEFMNFEGVATDIEEGEEEEAPTSWPNFPKYTVIGGVILLLIAGIAAVVYLTFGRVEVPDMVGMSSSAAIEKLNTLSLRATIVELEAPGVSPGRVIATAPAAHEAVLRGSMVTLTVAAAGEQVEVPDVAGKPAEEAKAALSSARLLVEEVLTFDNSVPPGTVVGFLPTNGTQVGAGSTVSVLVSKGSLDVPVEVPSVLGLSEEVAAQILKDEGFNPVAFYASASFGNLNEVISQTPGGRNRVSPGATVLFLVSLGNSTTDLLVPNVAGKRDIEAEQMISAAGFAAQRFNFIESTVATGTVISQMPPAEGTLLRAGTPLGYLVSTGAETGAIVPDVLGSDLVTAASELREAGFTARVVPRLSQPGPDEADDGRVVQQFPRGGTTYHIGLPVLLYVTTDTH